LSTTKESTEYITKVKTFKTSATKTSSTETTVGSLMPELVILASLSLIT
jgi:hypothetical protein